MTHAVRLSLYYFIHFAVVGAVIPFVALWFAWLGQSPSQTGLVVATPSFLMVATTLTLGSWADRLDDWRTAIIGCNWIAFGLTCWWLLRTGTADIWIVWALVGIVLMAKQPIVDAAALKLTQREGIAFGRVRAFGSIGFIASLLACGYLFRDEGIARFLPVILVLAALRIAAAHAMPRLRAQAPRVVGESSALLRHLGFLCVLAGSALIHATHAFYYTFGLLHWQTIGIGTQTASMLWAVAVLVEVVLMWQFARVAKRVSARHCLVVAALAGVIRWCVMALEPGLAVLAVMQALHALTFGLSFLATATFISRRIGDAHAARAQSLFAVFTTGSMAVLTLSSGVLYEALAGRGYFVMSAFSAVGLLLVMASYRTDLAEWSPSESQSEPVH